MKRMARLVLMAVGVLWGGLAPRLLVLEAGSATASDGTVLQTPEAGTVLKGRCGRSTRIAGGRRRRAT